MFVAMHSAIVQDVRRGAADLAITVSGYTEWDAQPTDREYADRLMIMLAEDTRPEVREMFQGVARIVELNFSVTELTDDLKSGLDQLEATE